MVKKSLELKVTSILIPGVDYPIYQQNYIRKSRLGVVLKAINPNSHNNTQYNNSRGWKFGSTKQ
jgi:hypothetical protein